MQLLTPKGYRDIASCNPGDTVVGEQGINRITAIERVDIDEWCRWHQGPDLRIPNFCNVRINDGDFDLFSEQSILHNDHRVTHARLLRPGNVIFHRGRRVLIKRIRQIDAKPWHRLEVDGDHTYIGDGLKLHNASRFWVGGTGTWDLSDTTHWAATSGGSGGQSAPGAADDVTLNGSSGGGTVTPNYGGTGTFQSITCGAFTGTIAWNTNNNNVTLSSITAFNGSGTGIRTINLGNGTWSLTETTANGNVWQMTVITNLTWNANSSTISFTGNRTGANTSIFSTGALTYSTVNCVAQSLSSTHVLSLNIPGATITNLTVAGPCLVQISSASGTITNINLNGTPRNVVFLTPDSFITQRTITNTTLSASWAAIRGIIFSGSNLFANNSFDLGANSGVTINPPSTSLGIPKFGMGRV